MATPSGNGDGFLCPPGPLAQPGEIENPQHQGRVGTVCTLPSGPISVLVPFPFGTRMPLVPGVGAGD
ncbi:MAG: hypothetical protein WDN49_08180 [Acetobacteraceae bacterium]